MTRLGAINLNSMTSFANFVRNLSVALLF